MYDHDTHEEDNEVSVIIKRMMARRANISRHDTHDEGDEIVMIISGMIKSRHRHHLEKGALDRNLYMRN